MENHKLVLPAHLNHYGYLFGGSLLKWVDEYAWIAATLEYPGCKFVTIGMDRVEFRKSVREGTILRFDIQPALRGKSSVQYKVLVYADAADLDEEETIFTTKVTFVCLDEQGKKRSLQQLETD